MRILVGFSDMIRESHSNLFVGFGIDYGLEHFKLSGGFKECFWCVTVDIGCGSLTNELFEKVQVLFVYCCASPVPPSGLNEFPDVTIFSHFVRRYIYCSTYQVIKIETVSISLPVHLVNFVKKNLLLIKVL